MENFIRDAERRVRLDNGAEFLLTSTSRPILKRNLHFHAVGRGFRMYEGNILHIFFSNLKQVVVDILIL